MFKLKTGLALIALSVGAIAHAQTFPADNGNSSTGSDLLLSVWDTSRNVSVVYLLPTNFGAISTAGGASSGSLTLPSIAQFATSNVGDLRYQVFGNGTVVGNVSGAQVRSVMVTSTATPTALVNGTVDSTLHPNGNQFITNLNAICTSGTFCAAEAAGPTSGGFAGAAFWGSNFGGVIGLNGAAAPGTALAFYQASVNEEEVFGQAVIQSSTDSRLRNLNLSFLLDFATSGSSITGGSLAWTNTSNNVVPLPAAAWLLLSGVTAFGAIGRRNKAAAAAAAA